MQLGNSRVWDYVGDNFVHRLLQNKADGKLVEVEGPTSRQPLTSQYSLSSDYFQLKLYKFSKKKLFNWKP